MVSNNTIRHGASFRNIKGIKENLWKLGGKKEKLYDISKFVLNKINVTRDKYKIVPTDLLPLKI